jgi:hypothetical protein
MAAADYRGAQDPWVELGDTRAIRQQVAIPRLRRLLNVQEGWPPLATPPLPTARM